jgi:hypothetical protein
MPRRPLTEEEKAARKIARAKAAKRDRERQPESAPTPKPQSRPRIIASSTPSSVKRSLTRKALTLEEYRAADERGLLPQVVKPVHDDSLVGVDFVPTGATSTNDPGAEVTRQAYLVRGKARSIKPEATPPLTLDEARKIIPRKPPRKPPPGRPQKVDDEDELDQYDEAGEERWTYRRTEHDKHGLPIWRGPAEGELLDDEPDAALDDWYQEDRYDRMAREIGYD